MEDCATVILFADILLLAEGGGDGGSYYCDGDDVRELPAEGSVLPVCLPTYAWPSCSELQPAFS